MNNHSSTAERLRISKSSIFKRKKKVKSQRPLAQEPSVSYLWVDKMQVEKDRSNHFGRNGLLYKHRRCEHSQSTSKKLSFRTFKYKYNVHLALMNTSWNLVRDMALGAHGWPRRYLPHLRLGKYVDSVIARTSGHMALTKYQPTLHSRSVNIVNIWSTL